IFEEVIFRGLIYSWLRVQVGVYPAAILSGCIFGAIHMDGTAFFLLMGVGVVLALAYEKSGTLLTPIVIHILNNLIWAIFWVI
ncbi:MAG: CPBP family intramembrane metalloprotease, partial [Cyanobacteria bacterium]|nr:CPBP family intramembrane metalloprotease [Cyanobacteriota bacterium]